GKIDTIVGSPNLVNGGGLIFQDSSYTEKHIGNVYKAGSYLAMAGDPYDPLTIGVHGIGNIAQALRQDFHNASYNDAKYMRGASA
ncbi:hypothetical protein ACXYUI_30405, partial [Klebsiella pneumoniae]